MVGDGNRVDQEAIVPLELKEQVVAIAQDGHILRRNRCIELDPIDIGRVAKLVDRVLVTLDAEHISVGTEATGNHILAKASFEGLVGGAARESVGVHRANQHFDIRQRVAQSFACKAETSCKIDRHRVIGLAVVGDVETTASVEDVRAATAADTIVAIVAADCIVVVGSLHDLDTREDVT